MAGRHGVAQVTDVTTGAGTKTIIQVVAATNHAIRITEIGVGFDGQDNTEEPVLVDIMRQTDAGTASALTPRKADDSQGDTFDTTAQHTATVEPAAGDILRTLPVHPQTSVVIPISDQAPIIVGAGDRLGLRVQAPDTHECSAWIAFEE